MPYHILVADDDDGIRELLGQFLQTNGYITSLVDSISSCEKIVKNLVFDLLIIDVMLPDGSGLEFVRQHRDHLACPIIMLTALGDVDDRITGLSSGANDYLAKPFDPQELLLRMRNLLNYTKSNKDNSIISFGKMRYDLTRRLLLDEYNIAINLTTNEQILLHNLIYKIGQVVSREEITTIFPGCNLRSIDTLVARVRAKIEYDSKNPMFLQTVRGYGYVFRG